MYPVAQTMRTHPTRLSSAVFRAKAFGLRLLRRLQDLDSRVAVHSVLEDQLPIVAAQSITPLWTDPRETEQWYQRGKVQNLRLAADALNGCTIPAGQVFSFWRQVGPPTRARGFVPGRMLQEGCLLPSVGGGLCQLTNALFHVASASGCEIVERHAHSRTVPGSATAAGRDATVAWNYIDLRFRPPCNVQLLAELTSESLVLSLRAEHPLAISQQTLPGALAAEIGPDHACDTCNAAGCRHKAAIRVYENGTNRRS